MKDIIIPVSLPEDIQGPEQENAAIEYAKQVLEEQLRAEFKKERSKKNPIWEELPTGGGVYIRHDSEVVSSNWFHTGKYSTDRNVFRTEKHAKAALAMAQISQLMPYYGGEITNEEWRCCHKAKYIIARDADILGRRVGYTTHQFVAFRTEEDRTRFISREENVRLVKDYYMMD